MAGNVDALYIFLLVVSGLMSGLIFTLVLAPLASLGLLMPFFISGLFCRNGQCMA